MLSSFHMGRRQKPQTFCFMQGCFQKCLFCWLHSYTLKAWPALLWLMNIVFCLQQKLWAGHSVVTLQMLEITYRGVNPNWIEKAGVCRIILMEITGQFSPTTGQWLLHSRWVKPRFSLTICVWKATFLLRIYFYVFLLICSVSNIFCILLTVVDSLHFINSS